MKTKGQESLPGMEDTKITEIENLALKYAGVRDERMVLTQEEGQLKKALLTAMKKAHKKTYKRHIVEVQIVME